jgi:hypothetical protein
MDTRGAASGLRRKEGTHFAVSPGLRRGLLSAASAMLIRPKTSRPPVSRSPLQLSATLTGSVVRLEQYSLCSSAASHPPGSGSRLLSSESRVAQGRPNAPFSFAEVGAGAALKHRSCRGSL